jgi:gliding motility-associated-like protein
MYLLKYSLTGTLLWARHSDCQGQDGAWALAVDSVGNAYVTGYYEWGTIRFDTGVSLSSTRGSGQMTTFVVKYDPAGNAIMALQPGGITNSRVKAITLDPIGNVYIAGTFDEYGSLQFGTTTLTVATGKGEELFLAKYSPLGQPLWAIQSATIPFGSVRFGNAEDITGLAVDQRGQVWLTGNTKIPRAFGSITLQPAGLRISDAYVVKFSAQGQAQWGWTLNNPGEDTGKAIAVDAAGNAYVTGTYQQLAQIGTTVLTTTGGGTHTFVAKFDRMGTPQWARQNVGTGSTIGAGLGLDACGGVYVSGMFSATTRFGTTALTSWGETDAFVVRYDTVGTVSWALSGGGARMDRVQTLAVAPNGELVTGGDYLGGSAQFGSSSLPFTAGNSHVWVAKVEAPCSPLPPLSAGPNQVVCPGTSLRLGNGPGQPGLRYEWRVSPALSGFPTTGAQPSLVLPLDALSPTYTFVLTAITPLGCRFEDSVRVHVASPGVPTVTGAVRCSPGTLTLAASGAPAGSLYQWYATASSGTALTGGSSGLFTTPILATTTTYYVAIRNASGCVGPRQRVVASIESAVPALAGLDQQGCAGQTIQLGRPSQATLVYQWSPATGLSDASAAQPTLQLQNDSFTALTRVYTLRVRTPQGCESIDSMRVLVYPLPPTPTIHRTGRELTSSAATNNQWLLNGVPLSGGSTPTWTVTQAGEYSVRVRTAAGCESQASMVVTVTLTELLPNIITPNHDGLNDIFPVRSLGPDLWDIVIFNRWGREVYRAAPYQDTWDADGLPDGVYYYWLRRRNDSQQVKGWVEVLR